MRRGLKIYLKIEKGGLATKIIEVLSSNGKCMAKIYFFMPFWK